jgi:2-polyprenyl-3-methyl-5-hydroxy-6-metoxy-1,4-benzoquinol methylase
MSENLTYEQRIAAEAELWGTESQQSAQAIPPDWRYHSRLRHNIIMHGQNIEELLGHIQPGMKTLELGCASGWLTLAMAQRGADASGIDISEKSLNVARVYYESIQDEVSGTVSYQVGDLNAVKLPSDSYDVIIVKASLHHLIEMEHVIDEIYAALKSGGLFWVADTNGDEALSTVLAAAVLTFLLPTQVSYGQKIRGLLRFGLRAPSRVKASIQAEGLSPFEGAGREHDWAKLTEKRFSIEKRVDMPAVTGYVTAQLRAPDGFALPFLKALRRVDSFLVRLKLLRNTGVVLYARK